MSMGRRYNRADHILFLLEQEDDLEITSEMRQHYHIRTQEHIDRVAANMKQFVGVTGAKLSQLEAIGEAHDQSKFDPVERVGYIWITEKYRAQREGDEFNPTPRIKDMMERASEHHVHHNKHHPEAHRDPNEMSYLDLMEMVADWTAMSQELGQNGGSAKEWAKENIKKWDFNEGMKKKIFTLIDVLDSKNGV